MHGTHSIIGRTLVIHGDDLGQGGDPGNVESGNTGPRMPCGIVESETGKITIFEAHFTQIERHKKFLPHFEMATLKTSGV